MEYINSENEKIAIEDRKLNGQSVKCLVIYDDPWPAGSGIGAPMLLDSGVQEFLLKGIFEINNEETRLKLIGLLKKDFCLDCGKQTKIKCHCEDES